ncbi:3-phosphoshikimate 1-carboxyvinyltransferase [Cytophagaceae bacterium ABcell3]|nr:3-phosphoshikimate 1-carboxyvinyltransferase [Cytophagaceae bacterium ABcell3]
MNILEIKKHSGKVHCTITPPSSKSESNRALIINALTGFKSDIQNASNARDTQTMIRLLQSEEKTLDVIDAGTTMRFLTAYLAITGQNKILTGTKRMCERPIKLLVDALRTLGANITYLGNEGYPPLEIHHFDKSKVPTNKLSIRGDVSSQYITALLMVAPVLPEGLVLELTGKIGSRPYIEMTLSLMAKFGIQADWTGNTITIKHQEYKPATYKIESDWSGASYWFSIAALADEAEIKLEGYKKDSYQGDHVITEIMEHLGVKTTFTESGLLLQKSGTASDFSFDFTHCPDLAQTIAVACAAKGIECTMSGLESLRIKETDRIAALQNELKKFGTEMVEVEKDVTYKVLKSDFKIDNQQIATYKDHRMAMAFAPLALLGEIAIEQPDVVDKSYPDFWKDLSVAGFSYKD